MGAKEEMAAKQAANAAAGQEHQLQKMQEQQKQQEEMEERKRVMIRQILEPDALERLNRLGIVKPDKRQMLEAHLLQLVQAGHIQEKLSDNAIVQLLEKLEAQT